MINSHMNRFTLGHIKKLVNDHPHPTLKNGLTHIFFFILPKSWKNPGKYRIKNK